mmetsp:Transcript_46345/g.56161  ORF Transcript_46345/g.56161 Transcript_46345/m.56161 type:complete len:202 (+) Transcript_46345:405-1010(+)
MNEISSAAPPVAPCLSLALSMAAVADVAFGSSTARLDRDDVALSLLVTGGGDDAVLLKEIEDTGAEGTKLSSIFASAGSFLIFSASGATSISSSASQAPLPMSFSSASICTASSTEASIAWALDPTTSSTTGAVLSSSLQVLLFSSSIFSSLSETAVAARSTTLSMLLSPTTDDDVGTNVPILVEKTLTSSNTLIAPSRII